MPRAAFSGCTGWFSTTHQDYCLAARGARTRGFSPKRHLAEAAPGRGPGDQGRGLQSRLRVGGTGASNWSREAGLNARDRLLARDHASRRDATAILCSLGRTLADRVSQQSIACALQP